MKSQNKKYNYPNSTPSIKLGVQGKTHKLEIKCKLWEERMQLSSTGCQIVLQGSRYHEQELGVRLSSRRSKKISAKYSPPKGEGPS